MPPRDLRAGCTQLDSSGARRLRERGRPGDLSASRAQQSIIDFVSLSDHPLSRTLLFAGFRADTAETSFV